MKKNLKFLMGCGAIVAVCLAGSYLHVKYGRTVEVGSEDMGKVFAHNIEYVMKCKTLVNVSKEDYDWYFENVYRLYYTKNVDGKAVQHKVKPEMIYYVQQEINKYIAEESNPFIPNSYYESACKIKVNNAMSQMESLLEQKDVVYKYFGKY